MPAPDGNIEFVSARFSGKIRGLELSLVKSKVKFENIGILDATVVAYDEGRRR